MATYRFQALDQDGEEIRDTVEAASAEDAHAVIRRMGYFTTYLTEGTGLRRTPRGFAVDTDTEFGAIPLPPLDQLRAGVMHRFAAAHSEPHQEATAFLTACELTYEVNRPVHGSWPRVEIVLLAAPKEFEAVREPTMRHLDTAFREVCPHLHLIVRLKKPDSSAELPQVTDPA
jgi:hypothetical protein